MGHSLVSLSILSTCVVFNYAFNLTILHTNDVHARIEEVNKYAASCNEQDAIDNRCYGGVARRHTVIEGIRNVTENVLLLDAGDTFQGTLWFTHYEGLEASLFMNILGYDAMVLGNHEFDNGVMGLAPFLRNATFPVLSCNVDASRDSTINGLFQKSVVVERAGERIGLIGYTTSETKFLVSVGGIRNIVFKDEISSIQEEVDRLSEQGINKLILIGHGGYLLDMRIAREVSGLDVIIGGHSNTFLYSGIDEEDVPSNEDSMGEYPTVVQHADGSHALVVQAYAYGKYLGYLETTFDDQGVITHWNGNPILLDGSYEQDPQVLSLVHSMGEPLREIRAIVVGATNVFLGGPRICRLQECNLGNMIADSIIEYQLVGPSTPGGPWTETSLGMLNGGGFRVSTVQGNITMEQVLAILPFRNTIVMVRLTGQTILAALEHSAKYYNPIDPDGAFLQFSGFRVVYDVTRPAGNRVVSVLVRCQNCTIPSYESLDLQMEYNVLINDFMKGGGDGYDMIRDNIIEMRDYGNLMSDALAYYIRKRGTIIAGLEGRITMIREEHGMSTLCPTPEYPSTQYRLSPKWTSQYPTDAPLPPSHASMMSASKILSFTLFALCLLFRNA